VVGRKSEGGDGEYVPAAVGGVAGDVAAFSTALTQHPL